MKQKHDNSIKTYDKIVKFRKDNWSEQNKLKFNGKYNTIKK